MSHLPYHGNLRDAIRAQDRPAIMEIMAWNRAHPIQYEEEAPLPEEARSCTNTEDYISHQTWSSDYLPNVYIRYMNADQRIGAPMCYQKDDLLRLFDTLDHGWVIPYTNPGLYLDNDGKVRSPYNSNYKGYGEHSQVEKFVRIPPAYHIEYHSLLEGLNNSTSLIAIPIYQTRVGNAEGSYGESRSHGQAPDVTIYYVVDADLFENNPERMYNYIYRKLYKLKTDVELPSSLAMIQQLQVDFKVAKKDRELYHNILSANDYGDYGEQSEEEYNEEAEENLPKIPAEELTDEAILNVMFDWIVHPPKNREKRARMFEGTYRQYEFNDKVIEHREDDFLNTATFVDRDPILDSRSLRIPKLTDALIEFGTEPNITSSPLYEESQEGMDPHQTVVFGSMLLLINEILTTSGLSLWINSTVPMEVGPVSLSFGDYEIPEGLQNIYDVILGSTFEASRINTDHYHQITYWDDWPDELAIGEVVNFILSHPEIRDQIFERYYLVEYDFITIGDIYNMFYLLFQAGYEFDSHTFEISSPGTITNIKSLIQNYTENTVLMAYDKQPKLQNILGELGESGLLNQLSYYIGSRLREIKRDRTIVFINRFKYAGTTGLNENYQNPPGISDDTLLLLFYTDPDFAELIGPVTLHDDDIQTIRDIVHSNI